MQQFGQRDDLAERWLVTPKLPLCGEKPITLMRSGAGKEAVIGMLERMLTGDFS
ncbi:MbcA/ParS/Xre antitoxin family protein [Aliiglaciecola sp.]|nr:MbcA/ParS/Xre antitoxin family protein [Aliiglaciecola sp.]